MADDDLVRRVGPAARFRGLRRARELAGSVGDETRGFPVDLWDSSEDDDDRAADDDGELELHDDEDGEIQAALAERDRQQNPRRNRERGTSLPSVRWGDTQTFTFLAGAPTLSQSDQLLQVSLDRPLICSVHFTGKLLLPLQGASQLIRTTLEITVGVGSSKTMVRKQFFMQPDPATELDVIFPAQPVQTLLAVVTALGVGDPTLVATYNLALAPMVYT